MVKRWTILRSKRADLHSRQNRMQAAMNCQLLFELKQGRLTTPQWIGVLVQPVSDLAGGVFFSPSGVGFGDVGRDGCGSEAGSSAGWDGEPAVPCVSVPG